MDRILVAYASMAGSTAEVARVVGEEIAKSGLQVDVLPLSEVEDLAAYAGVVVGGPMIMGWDRSARGFLKKHRRAFQRLPLAVFVMAMSVTKTVETKTGETQTGGTQAGETPSGVQSASHPSIYVDDKLPKPPLKAGSLSFRERYARLSNYLNPILKATHPVKPASIGVFGGRLEYGRLKWWAVLFVMLIIQAPAGDRRNWPAIREWAAELPARFQVRETKA